MEPARDGGFHSPGCSGMLEIPRLQNSKGGAICHNLHPHATDNGTSAPGRRCTPPHVSVTRAGVMATKSRIPRHKLPDEGEVVGDAGSGWVRPHKVVWKSNHPS